MKKVLLSLVASTLLFNTIYAEEIKSTEEVTQNEMVLTSSPEDVKTYVAQIKDVKYETFDEAVTAAVDGDTIKLLDNATTKGLNF